MTVEQMKSINGNAEVVIVSPYQNEPSDISVECSVLRDGKLKLVPDHEFTVVPIEWYGAHNWYERKVNSILNELVKIRTSGQSLGKDEILDRVDSLVRSLFERVNTDEDIPERTQL